MENQTQKTVLWTVRDVLKWTADYFKGKGIATPRLDAEVLLAHSLGIDRLRLYLDLDRPLHPEERSRFKDLVRRRAAREPVAFIVGTREFWSISLRVSPGVLIPRPDTEILVESVLDRIRAIECPIILEIGTGSAAISVAVARDHRRARILATDISPAALAVARVNAREAGLGESIDFVAGDLFSALRPDARFDVICSNPPYVPTIELADLEPEITRFEPRQALDGGLDGLDVIRRLVREAGPYLKEHGALIIEIGDQQAESVVDLFSRLGGFTDVRTVPDLAGKLRVVVGTR